MYLIRLQNQINWILLQIILFLSLVYHYQIIVTIGTKYSKSKGVLELTFEGKRKGTVTFKDTNFIAGQKNRTLLLIPELEEKGGQPGPFEISKGSFSDTKEQIDITQIEINYMSNVDEK